MNSRIDHCNAVLAGGPRTITDKLQRVLNAAPSVITGTLQFDLGLFQTLHNEITDGFDVPPDRIFSRAVLFDYFISRLVVDCRVD